MSHDGRMTRSPTDHARIGAGLARNARSIGDAAAATAKAIRHRTFYWCRLHNGFLDMPLWRVVATEAKVHLTAVQAFVMRLDSFANQQTPRGDVTYFDPVEFGTALDLPAETAALLFATLESRGWIEQDHLASFWDRNRDSDADPAPTSASDRKRRERRFKDVLREIVKMEHCGFFTAEQSAQRQIQLHELRDMGKRGQMTWAEQQVALKELIKVAPRGVPRHDASRSARDGEKSEGVEEGAATSEEHSTKSDVTMSRDNRDRHARADHNLFSGAVENSGRNAAGESAGLSEGQAGADGVDPQAKAELWLKTTGRREAIERFKEHPGVIDTRFERWLREVGDDHAALAAIIEPALTRATNAGLFVAIVSSEIELYRERQKRLDSIREDGPQLPLKTAIDGGRSDPHVTKSRSPRDAVDNFKSPDLAAAVERLRKAVGDG